MADQGTEVTSGVGRIVWGDPTTPRDKIDQDTKQKVLNADGTVKKQTSFGVAFPKVEFQSVIWPAMHAESAKGFPAGVPNNFSWKYVDGDGVDSQGKPYAERPGYAGCIVLAISTELQPPGIFKLENGVYRQMQPNEIKCGDYVRMGLNFKVNIPTNRLHKPGLFVNPQAVEFIGYGEEIKTGFVADPNALFGGQQVALPPGASATPVAAPGGAQMPGMGAAPPAPGGMPGNPTMPGAPAMVAPAPPQTIAPSPVAAPAPPPPTGPQRPTDPSHIHAAGTPGEQWWINGAWTPAPQQPAPPTMPPPATDFIPGAPAAPGGMPGMPAPR